MENASKALIMAAGVLIGIMVLSIAVYLFATFGTRSAELHRQIDDDRLNQFNTQFTSYELNNEITIYDVITVANLATENNTYYELPKVQAVIINEPSNYYVQVNLKNDKYNGPIEKGYTENGGNNNNDYNDIILNDTSKINNTRSLQKYNCTTHTSTITRKSI
mgnify:CR=1 FL=1